jgi:hypothetical protein
MHSVKCETVTVNEFKRYQMLPEGTILIRLSDTGLTFTYSIRIGSSVLASEAVPPVVEDNDLDDSDCTGPEPAD